VNTVDSQDGCTDAQATLATNSVCLELLDTLDDFNATSSASNPLCMDHVTLCIRILEMNVANYNSL